MSRKSVWMPKSSPITSRAPDCEWQLMELPPELFGRILSFLTYDDLASTARLVSRSFNNAAKLLLNSGFSRVDRSHGQLMATVKSQLPRRESERRNHSLARHNDILTAVETRISLMGMTFNKYIEADLCCFIPGKVLDELCGVLRTVKQCLVSGEQPARPHELLQELRDISSMAMEHFEEHIAPQLRDSNERSGEPAQNNPFSAISIFGAAFAPPSLTAAPAGSSNSAGPSTSNSNSPPTAGTPGYPFGFLPCMTPTASRMQNLSKELGKLKQKCSIQSKTITSQKNDMLSLKVELSSLKKKQTGLNRVISEQNRKFEEFSRKYETLLAELRSEIRTPNTGFGGNTESNYPKPARNQMKAKDIPILPGVGSRNDSLSNQDQREADPPVDSHFSKKRSRSSSRNNSGSSNVDDDSQGNEVLSEECPAHQPQEIHSKAESSKKRKSSKKNDEPARKRGKLNPEIVPPSPRKLRSRSLLKLDAVRMAESFETFQKY